MVRLAVVTAALLALPGCGGDPPSAPVVGGAVTGEIRSPDARTPFVHGQGAAWQCEAGGPLELGISADGQAVVTLGGRTLASVIPGRALVNRDCDRATARRLPPIDPAGSTPGGAALRCRAHGAVLVDLRRGDLVVRRADDRRFLAGAAVSDTHLEVGGYWSRACSARLRRP